MKRFSIRAVKCLKFFAGEISSVVLNLDGSLILHFRFNLVPFDLEHSFHLALVPGHLAQNLSFLLLQIRLNRLSHGGTRRHSFVIRNFTLVLGGSN